MTLHIRYAVKIEATRGYAHNFIEHKGTHNVTCTIGVNLGNVWTHWWGLKDFNMHFHDIPRYPNSFWTDSAWVYKCHYALSGSYEVMSISVAIFSNGSQMIFISGSSRFYPSSGTLYEFRTCTMKPWVRDRCCRFYVFWSQDHKFAKLNLKTAGLQTSSLKTGGLKMCSSKTASFKTGSFNTCSLKTASH